MDTELIAEVRQTAQKFATRHIEPIAANTDHNDPVFPGEIFSLGIEAGFDRFVLPEDAGGYGFGMAELCGLIQTLSSTCAAHAMVFGVHAALVNTIFDAGNEKTKSLLEEIFSSGKPLGAAVCDPDEKEGFETELTLADTIIGNAGFCVNGTPEGYFLLFAKHADNGPVAMIAKGDGLEIGNPELTLGLRAMPMVECKCDNVPVSSSAIIASGKDAEDLFKSFLVNMSLVASAAAAGLMESATKKAAAYAAERYQGGKMIIDHSHMRNIMGAMSVQVSAAQGALYYQASNKPDLPSVLATKAMVTDSAMKVCTDAVQVLGGYGYMREYGLEKAMRDAAVLALLPISNIRAELLIAAIDKSNL